MSSRSSSVTWALDQELAIASNLRTAAVSARNRGCHAAASAACTGVHHPAVGAAFAGVAAVTAQLAASSAWPAGLSPVGWGQQIRPFDRDRWPLLGLFAVVLAAGTAVACHLADRRDHGLGLLPPRRGRSAASRALRGPLGLLLLFATGMALTTGAALGNTGGHLRDLLLAALVQAPGPLVLGAAVVSVVGVAPRAAAGVSWTMLLAAVLTGPIFDLGLPRRVHGCSPFTHVPMAPAARITPPPLLALLAVCAALVLVGFGSLRHRDLALPA